MLPFSERVWSVPRSRHLPALNRGIAVPKNPTTIGGHLRRRRLELGIHQSEAARILKVSTVTLSRWECDKVDPVWEHHRHIIEYLGHDPFQSCGLKDPYGNETNGGASFSPPSLGQSLKTRRLELKLTREECAQRFRVDPKTLRSWENGLRQPSRIHRDAIRGFLSSRIASEA